jgi:hypothetical protein
MQELIELIQSGDLTNNQVLQRVTEIHNTNVEETDAMFDRIEELESTETINRLVTLELKAKLVESEKLSEARKQAIPVIEEQALISVAYAQDLENKLMVKAKQLKDFNLLKGDAKKLKPRIQRLSEANKAHQKYRKIIKPQMKELNIKYDQMCRENAKLRMTGHKAVGKYNFTIFPVKVASKTTTERRVGLCVYNSDGTMKVLTRDIEGNIEQPKSHTFRFNQEESTWINHFFDVTEAHDNRFDDAVLRLVK